MIEANYAMETTDGRRVWDVGTVKSIEMGNNMFRLELADGTAPLAVAVELRE